jgi:hypothetical protein
MSFCIAWTSVNDLDASLAADCASFAALFASSTLFSIVMTTRLVSSRMVWAS